MLARNVRKAARSALWLPVPDGFWDANTRAVPSWMVTATSTRKPLSGGHCMLSSRAGAPPIVMAWSVCGVAGHGCAAAEARVVVLVKAARFSLVGAAIAHA